MSCTINEGDPYVVVVQSGCAYACVSVYQRSQNLCGVAGSSNFRRRAPVSHEKQGPHHCRVAIIHLHPLRP